MFCPHEPIPRGEVATWPDIDRYTLRHLLKRLKGERTVFTTMRPKANEIKRKKSTHKQRASQGHGQAHKIILGAINKIRESAFSRYIKASKDDTKKTTVCPCLSLATLEERPPSPNPKHMSTKTGAESESSPSCYPPPHPPLARPRGRECIPNS